MAQYRVNKEKCIGCGVCAAVCEKGAKMEDDGKAVIINSEETDKCGGESVCPYTAIVEAK